MQESLYTGGPRVLFLGVETLGWSAGQFFAAGAWAKAHGFTGVAVKVAEGTILWYGGYSGIAKYINVLKSTGVGVIPYVYGYPQYAASEVSIYAELMRQFGGVILDLETEFNGQIGAAQTLCNGLRGRPGKLYVTTWADPAEQNWNGVLAALAPAVDGWIPQAYTNWLQGAMNREYGNDTIYPAVSMTSEFGPNSPAAIVADARARQHAGIFVWEYLTAAANQGLVQQIINAYPGDATGETIVLQVNQTGGLFTETAPNRWHCHRKSPITGQEHDVALGILIFYRTDGQVGLNGFSRYGCPTTGEIQVPGHPGVVVQGFERGWICFDEAGVVDRVPGYEKSSCYPAHIDQFPGIDPRLDITQSKLALATDTVAKLTAQAADLQAKLTDAEAKLADALKNTPDALTAENVALLALLRQINQLSAR